MTAYIIRRIWQMVRNAAHPDQVGPRQVGEAVGQLYLAGRDPVGEAEPLRPLAGQRQQRCGAVGGQHGRAR